MNTNDHDTANHISADDYIALAHRLRAEAVRNTLVAMFSGVKRAIYIVSAWFHRSAKA